MSILDDLQTISRRVTRMKQNSNLCSISSQPETEQPDTPQRKPAVFEIVSITKSGSRRLKCCRCGHAHLCPADKVANPTCPTCDNRDKFARIAAETLEALSGDIYKIVPCGASDILLTSMYKKYLCCDDPMEALSYEAIPLQFTTGKRKIIAAVKAAYEEL